MGNGVNTSVLKICDSRTCSAAGTDRSAVSREPSDAGLEMDRHKVGNKKCAQQLLMCLVVASCEYDDRDAGCYSLVAASGVYDYRQLASVHTGVTCSCGIRSHPVCYIIRVT